MRRNHLKVSLNVVELEPARSPLRSVKQIKASKDNNALSRG